MEVGYETLNFPLIRYHRCVHFLHEGIGEGRIKGVALGLTGRRQL